MAYRNIIQHFYPHREIGCRRRRPASGGAEYQVRGQGFQIFEVCVLTEHDIELIYHKIWSEQVWCDIRHVIKALELLNAFWLVKPIKQICKMSYFLPSPQNPTILEGHFPAQVT